MVHTKVIMTASIRFRDDALSLEEWYFLELSHPSLDNGKHRIFDAVHAQQNTALTVELKLTSHVSLYGPSQSSSDAEGKVDSPDVVRAPENAFHGGSISRIAPVVLSHNIL